MRHRCLQRLELKRNKYVRMFTYNQVYPYSECKDLSSFQSELFYLIKQSNYQIINFNESSLHLSNIITIFKSKNKTLKS